MHLINELFHFFLCFNFLHFNFGFCFFMNNLITLETFNDLLLFSVLWWYLFPIEILLSWIALFLDCFFVLISHFAINWLQWVVDLVHAILHQEVSAFKENKESQRKCIVFFQMLETSMPCEKTEVQSSQPWEQDVFLSPVLHFIHKLKICKLCKSLWLFYHSKLFKGILYSSCFQHETRLIF